jgi:hypothetical protein
MGIPGRGQALVQGKQPQQPAAGDGKQPNKPADAQW